MLFSSLRNQRIRVLRDATQLWYNFSQQPQRSCRRFLFFFGRGIVALLSVFVWLFIDLMMREQTRIPGFASRFCFIKLTLGRMPIFTRRSHASTCQLMSARSSKNGTNGTFCLGYFSSSTHSDLVKRMALEVWRHRDLVFGTIVTLMLDTALVSFRTLAFFFHLSQVPFPPSTPLFPFDS